MEAVFGCFRMGRSPRRTTMAVETVETSFRTGRSLRLMTTAAVTAATFGWFSFFVRSQGYSGLRAVSSEVGVWP